MSNPIDDSLGDDLSQLGVGLGLLSADGEDLNQDWFLNPLNQTRAAWDSPTRRQALLDGLDAILQGTPAELEGVARRIRLGDAPVELLLQVNNGGVLRVGVAFDRDVPAGNADLAFSLTGWLMELHRSTDSPVVTFPLTFEGEIGVDLSAVADSPVRSLELSLTLDVEVNGTTTGTVRLEVDPAGDAEPFALELSFPTADPDAFEALALDALAGLLQVALAAAREHAPSAAVARVLGDLLGLVGLAETQVGGVLGSLPRLDLAAFASNPIPALGAWLGEVFTGADALNAGKRLLHHAAGLLRGADVAIAVRHDPALPVPGGTAPGWAAVVHDDVLRFELRAWVATDASGAQHLHLGLGLDGDPVVSPGALALQFGVCLSLLRLRLGPNPTLEGALDLDLRATLAHPTAGADLLTFTAAGQTVALRAVEAGLRLDARGTLRPTLDLLDVRLAGHTLPRFALADLENLGEAAAAAAAGGLTSALNGWLGADLTVAGTVAERLGGLLGLVPIPSAPAGWPSLDLALLTSDPAAAAKAWLAALARDVSGHRFLEDWLVQLRRLLADLSGLTLPAVTGSGTEADPWVVLLRPADPSLALHVWLPPAAAGRVAVRAAVVVSLPALTPGATRLTTDLRVGLLDADLPLPSSSGSTVTFLTDLALVARLRPAGAGPLQVVVPGPLPLTIVADGGTASLTWSRGAVLTPELTVDGLAVHHNGAPLALPRGLRLVNLDAAVADLVELIPTLFAAGLAALSEGASERALALARLVGQWVPDGAWSALSAADLAALLADPIPALTRLLGQRLGEVAWTSPAGHHAAVELLWHAVHGGLGADLSLPANRPAVGGAGTITNPWSVSLAGPGAALPVDLLVWLGPDGPAAPDAAARAALVDRLLPAGASGPALVGGLRAAGEHLPDLGRAVASWSDSFAGAALSAAEATLRAAPELNGGAVAAAVAAKVSATSADAALYLLGPGELADTWPARVAGSAVVDVVDATATTAATARSAGVTAISAAADAASAGSRVVLVASSASLAVARDAAAALAGRVVGVVSLAPTLAPTDPLVAGVQLVVGGVESTGEAVADGARLAASLLAATGSAATGATAAALDRVHRVGDGWRADPVTGAPIPLPPTPLAALTAADLPPAPSVETAVTAGLAAASWLRDTVRTAAADALSTALSTPRAAPTHVGVGARVRHNHAVDITLATHHALVLAAELSMNGSASSRALPAFELRSSLHRPDGWLLGDANEDPRLLRVDATLAQTSSGPVTATATATGASLRGRGVASGPLTDASVAPVLDALLADATGPLSPGRAGAALGGWLTAFDLATVTAGRVILARQPLLDFLADPAAWLRARLTLPSGDPNVAALLAVGGPLDAALRTLGFTPRGDNLGWTRDLAPSLPGGLHLDLRTGGFLELRGGAESTHLDLTATLDPFRGLVDAALDLHPTFDGWQPVACSLHASAGPSYANPLFTVGLDALDPTAHQILSPGPGLVGLGLDLLPPSPDLPLSLARAGARAAAQLAVRLLLEERVLPHLPAWLIAGLTDLRLVATVGGQPRVAALSAALFNPLAHFLSADVLAAVAGTVDLGGGLELVLTHTAGTPRTVSVLLRTAGAGLSLGDLTLSLSAGVAADLPAAGPPTNLRPTGSVTADLTLSSDGRGFAITVGVVGADVTVDLTARPPGVPPIHVRLLPWTGIGGLLAAQVEEQLLPRALEALVAQLRGGAAPVAAVGDALANLLLALAVVVDAGGNPLALLPAGAITVSGPRLVDLARDPAAALQGLLRSASADRAARLGGVVGFLRGLLTRLGVAVPAGTTLLEVPLAGIVRLVIGARADAANAFGAWLKLDPTGWAAAFPASALRPDPVDATWLGVQFHPTTGAPVAVFDLHLDLVLDLAALSPGATIELGGDLSLTTAGAPALSFAVESGSVTLVTLTLLPTFGVQAPSGDAIAALLQSLGLQLALTAVNTQALRQVLLDRPLHGSLTVGDLLAGAGLLAVDGPRWRVPTVDALAQLTALTAALGAVAKAIEELAPAGVGVYKDGAFYGVSFAAREPIRLSSSPVVELLMGEGALTAALNATEGPNNYRARVQLLRGPPQALAFAPGLDARGLGLRLGHVDTPLLTDPVGVDALELGFDVKVPDAPHPFGVVAGLHGLRLPFGGSGAGIDNPVAASLFSDEAESPSISVIVTFRDGVLDLSLLGGAGPDGLIWLTIERSLGPLDLHRVGFGLADGGQPGLADNVLTFKLDASFGMAGLHIDAWGLGFQFPLGTATDLSTWRWTLDGLGVAYDNGTVTVAAALLKVGDAPPAYIGAAIVKVPGFELTAIGGYTEVDGEPSLFILAKVPIPLGGPPYFFIMGLAGGFGFNRGLELPASPGAGNENFFLEVLASDADLIDQLPTAAQRVPARRGSHWVAFGVKFLSFGIIHGNAMVYVLLDDGFTLGLLGLATLAIPAKGAAIASVELALDAGFSTTNDDPRLWVTAWLTENSWLLDPAVRLTGGFALFIWFKKADFVLTLGGYCSEFDKPAHYPDVERLGFRWQPSDNISIKGGCYFALTPREAMGGGFLEARAEFGPAKAGLEVSVDVMIGWDPFYYYFRGRIAIWGSIDLWLCEPSFDLEVDLTVRGPELGGRGRLKICGIGVTVEFGAQSNPRNSYVSLPDFCRDQLKLDGPTDALREVFTAEVVRGQVPSKGQDGTADGILRVTTESRLRIRSRLPATQTTLFVGMTWASDAQPENLPEDATLATDLDLVPAGKAGLAGSLAVIVSGADLPTAQTRAWASRTIAYASAQPVAVWAGEQRQTPDGRTQLLPATGDDPSVWAIDQLEIDLTPELSPASVPTLTVAPSDGPTFALPLTPRRGPYAELFDVADFVADLIKGQKLGRLADKGWLAERLEGLAVRVPVVDPVGPIEREFKPVAARVREAKVPAVRVREARRAGLTTTAVLSTTAAAAGGPAFTRTTTSVRAPVVAAPTALSPRGPALAGLRLVTAPARATAVAGATALRRDAPAAAEALRSLDKRLLGKGAPLAAGNTLVLDATTRGLQTGRLTLAGDQPVHLVALSRGGGVLLDREVAAGQGTLDLPTGTSRVVARALGGAASPKAQAVNTERPERASGPALRPGRELPPIERAPAEAARLPSEASRLPSEASRLPAEASRLPAEAARLPAEAARLPAEASRRDAEASRVAAEAARGLAERAPRRDAGLTDHPRRSVGFDPATPLVSLGGSTWLADGLALSVDGNDVELPTFAEATAARALDGADAVRVHLRGGFASLVLVWTGAAPPIPHSTGRLRFSPSRVADGAPGARQAQAWAVKGEGELVVELPTGTTLIGLVASTDTTAAWAPRLASSSLIDARGRGGHGLTTLRLEDPT